MTRVEICISADTAGEAEANARAAGSGGADRIEVCAAMDQGGLTPPPESIRAARAAFPGNGLIVMIRPRPGDFVYSAEEIALMRKQIEAAAKAGADGVVLGVLGARDGRICAGTLETLVATSRAAGSSVTFHRAIDASPDPVEALVSCIELGVDRVLTAGMAWGGEPPRDMELLLRMARAGAGKIELVAGGGIDSDNAPQIISSLSPSLCELSIHSWSGVLVSGATSEAGVR
ncbi:MAG TPA: copper homeostasis protein CutC, partial [Candidatus Krumholzibacterium sp.]|nr:copper homeostasis protein CutC [Candidatus Krumholzibacterium sp.]